MDQLRDEEHSIDGQPQVCGQWQTVCHCLAPPADRVGYAEATGNRSWRTVDATHEQHLLKRKTAHGGTAVRGDPTPAEALCLPLT